MQKKEKENERRKKKFHSARVKSSVRESEWVSKRRIVCISAVYTNEFQPACYCRHHRNKNHPSTEKPKTNCNIEIIVRKIQLTEK